MKRANGTGTVTKLSGHRRKPFCARVPVYDDDGILHQQSIGTYETRKAAQEALAEFNRASGNTRHKVGSINATIGDVYEAWQVKAFDGLSPKGVKNYTGPWKRRLEAHSDRRMRDMGIDDWQAIVDEDAATGLSSGSVQLLITLIKALNKYASMRDIIYKDYSQFITMPPITAEKVEKGALPPATVEKVKAMAETDPRAQIVLCLCYTGFRINELAGLTRDNYHAEPVPHFKQGSKTAAGKGRDGKGREVPIHPCIRPYVDAWLAKGGKGIFCRPKGTRYDTDGLREYIAPAFEAVGLPQATPHWCRYTFETMCKTAGIQPDLIDQIMGHAPKTMGDHYTDYDLAAKAAAVNKLP